MVCNRCGEPFNRNAHNACPYCGEPARIIMKSSMILIASGGAKTVYRSLDDVPSRLKARLLESTSNRNAATILIADRSGRDEVAKVIRGLPRPTRRRLAALMSANVKESKALRLTVPRLIAFLGIALSLVFTFLVFFYGYS